MPVRLESPRDIQGHRYKVDQSTKGLVNTVCVYIQSKKYLRSGKIYYSLQQTPSSQLADTECDH